MRTIKEFLNKKIEINIIDAIAITSLTLINQLSQLFDFKFTFIHFIIFVPIYIITKSLFMRNVHKREDIE